jgi:hypothetical protein
MRTGLLLVTLLATACARESVGTPEAQRLAAESAAMSALTVERLRAEPYSFAYSSGLEDSARLVVRDREAWEALWRRIHQRQSPLPPTPAVDFARQMVVAAALGTRPSGGYSIFVDSARGAGDGAVVVVRSVSPGARCGVTGALTEPVDVALVPRREGAVTFEERSAVHECP